MSNSTENKLIDSGRPLIFRVADPESLGLTAPKNRLGNAIRSSVRSLTVFQKEALVTSGRTGLSWRFASDEGPYLMGHDEAPAPLAYLTTGMVSSYMSEIVALSKSRNIDIQNIRLIQDNFYTMQGSMQQGTMTAGAKDVELEVQIKSDADKSILTTLAYDAVSASPLNGLMRGEKESLFTLTHNGKPVEPDKALEMDSEPLSDPLASFPDATPAEGNWKDHLVRGPLTPRNQNSTSSTGSSLQDQQSRILHLRGICTLRKDGTKLIEQQLFNPNGSIFYFLSDEGIEDGGQGRAPDAASYISAGIAFCFMTQFGRYAKMVKKDLKAYRVTQDSHFTLGGASGKTSKAGEADPLETHVYLDSGESDEFARTALDISEQTCFLHAFCRTALKARIKVSELTKAA